MDIEKYNFDQECGMQEHYSLGYFYSCKDIDPLLEELETLRASNGIKQANIELLEAENAKLIAWCDRMQNNIEGNEEHIKSLEEAFDKIEKYNWQLLAEREAMMKQPPRIWRRYAGIVAGSPCFAYREQEPMQDDGFEWVAFYSRPLPAQQIPEGYADKRKDSLLEYLKLQRRKLNSHYETRLKIVPSMDKEPWLSNIKKWDDWIDFVLSASQPKGES